MEAEFQEINLTPSAREYLRRSFLRECGVDLGGRFAMIIIQSIFDRDINIAERSGTELAVDWSSAAVAAHSRELWEIGTGETAPVAIHTDAPGPYGRLMTDTLEALVPGFRPGSSAPSARSAMRALERTSGSAETFASRFRTVPSKRFGQKNH